MKIFSAFDGIACGRVALERGGINVERYVASEIDKAAINVAKTNWPDIEEVGNIFDVDFSKYNDIDLLIGGSPCTNWSIANNKREVTASGIGWDLFSQYLRALKELKPKWFLYENNASMADEIKKQITKCLGVEPLFIDSANFSAQNRKRLYWTNIPVDKEKIKNHTCKDVINDIIYDDDYEHKSFEQYKETMKPTISGVRWDSSGKGYYSQHARAVAKDKKMYTVTANGSGVNIWLGGTDFRKIHPIEAERLQTLPDNYTATEKSDRKRRFMIGNGWTVKVIEAVLEGLK